MRRLGPVMMLTFLAVLSACRKNQPALPADPLRNAYDTEQDWNNSDRLIPLNYQQAQGKRLFYTYCVWCHADSTPAGPSNRGNLTPTPHLINDGSALNSLSDQNLENIIGLGGSAVGKSALMPPYGKALNRDEVRAIMAYMRAVAQPPYHEPARAAPGSERR